MARPQTDGIGYFPLDVDFFSDKKIKRLRARYGSDGILVYMYLLCEIYRNGYYIDYDEDLILDISDELNISENCTKQIMNYLFSRSLLDSTLAKSVKVLTAKSIQLRYQKAVEKRAKKRKSKCIEVEGKFWVLKKDETEDFIKVRPNDDYSENNYCFSENNFNNSEEKFTKESKVKKSKVNESKEVMADKPPASSKINLNSIFELFNKICKSYPKITAYSEDRKKAIKERLKSGYTFDDFKTVFEKAENSDFLKGKNNRNWSANFDWLIKDANIAKVLDGNYDDRSSNQQKEYSFNLDDYKGLINDFGDDESG